MCYGVHVRAGVYGKETAATKEEFGLTWRCLPKHGLSDEKLMKTDRPKGERERAVKTKGGKHFVKDITEKCPFLKGKMPTKPS